VPDFTGSIRAGSQLRADHPENPGLHALKVWKISSRDAACPARMGRGGRANPADQRPAGAGRRPGRRRESATCQILSAVATAAGCTAELVDADTGQKLVGPPTCMTLGSAGRLHMPVHGWPERLWRTEAAAWSTERRGWRLDRTFGSVATGPL